MPHDHVPSTLYLPPGFYQWSLRFTGLALPTGAAVTGCGVRTATPTPTSMAETMFGSVVANFLPLMSNLVTLSEVYIRLGSSDGTGESHTRFSASTGASTAGACSPGVAVLGRLSSGLGGRRGRGRLYLPGLTEPQVDHAGILLPTFVSAWSTALADWRTNHIAAGIPIAIGHRYADAFIGPKLPPTEITAASADSRVASQRKRQRR